MNQQNVKQTEKYSKSLVSKFRNTLKENNVCWSLEFVPTENLGLKWLIYGV